MSSGPSPLGRSLGGQRFDLFGQAVQLFLDGQNELAPDLQPLLQPVGQSEGCTPPFATQAIALGQGQAAALGGQALAFPPQLFALPTQDPALFFGRRRHAHHTHGPGVAMQVTIQFEHQFAAVGLVGHHALAIRIEFFGMHQVTLHSQRGELAVQVKAAGAGFIDDHDFVGQFFLLFDPFYKCGLGEALGRLRRLALAHAGHPQMVDVPVHPQLKLVNPDLRLNGGSCRTN